MNKKKVDVVIPVYHPGSEFKKLMERLERQTYEVNRIILMQNRDILKRILNFNRKFQILRKRIKESLKNWMNYGDKNKKI